MVANMRSVGSWARLVFTHNPFYIISAVLILYGLHVSFADRLDPTEGRLLLKILMGYTFLLGVTGVTIVRYGQVWEDARTLLLLVVLLIVALGSSFDRVCLDDTSSGALLLGVGLAFSIATCELLRRGLRVVLPWSYRVPVYLLLALLFVYPVWLGHLSLTGQDQAMTWHVLAFPSITALISLMLLPAVWRHGQDVTPNGTPWTWPGYPWMALAILGVASLIRAYSLSISFELAKGFTSGFHPYLLMPVLLAWLLLWAEGWAFHRPGWRHWILLAAPLALLAFCLPGLGGNPAQVRHVQLLQDSIGAPIQIAAVLLIGFYSYAWLRGMKTAEAGLVITMGVLAVVNRTTIDIHSFAPVQGLPVVIAICLLSGASLWKHSSLRMIIALVVGIAYSTFILRDTAFTAGGGFIPLHLTLLATMLIGLLFRDRLARWLALSASKILIAAALFAVVSYRFLFPDMAVFGTPSYVGTLGILGCVYWLRNRRFADLLAACTCFALSSSLVAERFLASSVTQWMLPGRQWLLWGIAFFAAGLGVSLLKGGQITRLYRGLKRIHIGIEQSRRE